jgi:hypothetical protein
LNFKILNFLTLSVFGNHVVHKIIPLVLKEFGKSPLFVLGDGAVLDGVDHELLEVCDIKLPADEDVQVVQGHAFIPHETGVIWRNGNGEALMQKASGWMAPQVEYISEHKVGHWTALNANSLFFHDLLQLWVVGQVEPMANSLGVEEDGIIQLVVVF